MAHATIKRGVIADIPFDLKDREGGNLVDDADWVDGTTAAQWPQAAWHLASSGADVNSDMVRDISGDTITSATHKHPDPTTGIWRSAQGKYFIRIEPAASLNLTEYDLDVTFDVTASEVRNEEHRYTMVLPGDIDFGDEPPYGDETVIRQRSGVTFDDLGLADDATYTELIADLNQRASDSIDEYAGRDFLQHPNDVVTLDGTNLQDMRLPGYPIISVSQVKEDDTVVPADEYRVKDATEAPHPGENPGILERKPPDVWDSEWERYEVTYTWGYEDVPNSIRQVAENMVIRALQAGKINQQASGASSISMDGFSISYDMIVRRVALTEDDKAVLERYRRIVTA